MPEPSFLLVEDNPDYVQLILRALRKNQIESNVTVAKDGVEALQFLQECVRSGQESLPAFVLLDLKLPKMDGLKVLQQIREDSQTSSIPVVVLSSSCEENDVRESYRLGANSYVCKPVDSKQFTDRIGLIGSYWLTVNRTKKNTI